MSHDIQVKPGVFVSTTSASIFAKPTGARPRYRVDVWRNRFYLMDTEPQTPVYIREYATREAAAEACARVNALEEGSAR